MNGPETGSELSLRPEVGGDADFLRDLFADVQGAILAALDPALREMLLRHQHAGQRATFAARYPDARREIVEHCGVAIGRLVTDRADGAVAVVDLAIGTAWRRRGFGTCLLHDLQSEASRVGKPLCLSVRTENAAARRLYARLGFTPVFSTDTDIALEWRPRS